MARLPIQAAGHALLLILGVWVIVTFPLVVYRLTGGHPLRIIVTAARRAHLAEGAKYLVGVLWLLPVEANSGPWSPVRPTRA